MRSQKGFSLIELLIVVAIILLIAAMALPSLLRSRISANEASAISSLRTVNTAQATYAIAYPDLGYSDQLTKLSTPPAGSPVTSNAAGLLDWVLGCASQPCTKSGYDFSVTNPVGTPVTGYTLTATPTSMGQTGVRGFCANQVPIVSYDNNGGTACTQIIQ